MWVVRTFGLWAEELEYTAAMIDDDVRNNSAWNQRFFCVAESGRKGAGAGAGAGAGEGGGGGGVGVSIHGAKIKPFKLVLSHLLSTNTQHVLSSFHA